MRRTAAVALLALCFPAAAGAHATLAAANPAPQSEIRAAPWAAELRFDQGVTAAPDSVRVWDAKGRLVTGPAYVTGGGRIVRASLRPLHRGAYTVRWRVLSSDGHVGSGVYTFGLGVTPPSPTEAFGSGGPSWSDDVARWGYFVSLALLLGGLSFRLLVLSEPVPSRVEKRLYVLLGVGAVAVLETGLTAFVLRAEDALQLPFTELLYGDLSPLATKTRFGIAFTVTTLGFAGVTALIFLAWLLDRPRLLWASFAATLALASGPSLSGHSALEPNASWVSELADWIHLSAASMWAGGLLALAVCVWPVAPELRRTAFLGFSRLATVLIAALVLAGLYLSLLRLPSLPALWEESYGRVLLVKLALVSVALAWGAVHKFIVGPRLATGGDFVGRSLVAESAVGIAVLLVAAILVNSAPPVATAVPGQAAAVRPR